jgi:hypothetical protein
VYRCGVCVQQGPSRGPKSSLALFRDCLRLVKHIAGASVSLRDSQRCTLCL